MAEQKFTWIYWEVKHPVIYLPGICQYSKETGREYQTTCVGFYRLFEFMKVNKFKWKHVSITPMCRLFIFFKYLWIDGPAGRIGISTAWYLSNVLKAN